MRKSVFVLGCMAVFWGLVVPAQAEEHVGSDKAIYQAKVNIDPQRKHITGSVDITFWPKDTKHAYLHLYPYAFASEHSGAQWDQLLGNDPTLATYASTKLSVDGKLVDGKRSGTILEVPLAEADDKKARSTPTKISLDFDLTLPLNDGRMSYDDHSIWLGNWLPILAVEDQHGWHLDPYEPTGDPFYSKNADYEVDVTLPEGYQLASSATDSTAEVNTSPSGNRTYLLRADDVRDFALVIMDGTYKRLEGKVGDTVIRTWWRNTDDADGAKHVHDAAAASLEYFNNEFGTYPYKEYDVVRVGGEINGMEYPALVFLDGSHFTFGGTNATATVVHETAHQWFYGLIGNDQIHEAWLDEGFTEYASLAFLSNKYPEVGFERVRKRLLYGTIVPFYVQEELRPWQELAAFPDNQSYSDLVYSRTSSMLWMLRGAWGEKRLHEVLHQYARKYRLGVADGEAWKTVLSEAAGEDASSFLDYWLKLDMSQQEAAAAWLERQRKASK